MYSNIENRKIFREKFKHYENYKNFIQFISEYEHHKYYYKLLYNTNQYGGNKYQINSILKQYPNYNVEIDELESDDNEVKVVFYTLDKTNICLSLIIDYVEKYATISDLHNYPNCIPIQDKKLTQILFEFSSELARQSNMTHIKLSDRSYYTCKGDNPFKNTCYTCSKTFNLSMANTLTNGLPYYYKYGFVHEDKYDREKVRDNKIKLKINTSEIEYLTLMNVVNNFMKKNKCNEQIKMEYLQYVASLYEKHYHNNIKSFFKDLKYDYCFLFCLIYQGLYDMMNLQVLSHLMTKKLT